jgi:diguanylate cyclase
MSLKVKVDIRTFVSPDDLAFRTAGSQAASGVSLMAAHSDEHERTMAFAEIALGQIKALRQAAIPRNYEIWYAYATGYNPSLNQSINETLSRDGALTPNKLDDLYNAYLSSTRLSDRIDTVGSKVVDEIDQIVAMIEAAVGTTSSYTESLADVSKRLGAADREGLRAIVELLVRSTREVEHTNQSLEARLRASKV